MFVNKEEFLFKNYLINLSVYTYVHVRHAHIYTYTMYICICNVYRSFIHTVCTVYIHVCHGIFNFSKQYTVEP